MATDFESLGARGTCVRMIIYWECAADPYIYSHSPFIPAEGGGCNTVDFSKVVGNSLLLNEFYISANHNPSKGFASTWKRNSFETPALEGDEGGAPSLSGGVGIY